MTAATRELARFVVATNYRDLPDPVRAEGPRSFLNWLGCAYGGLRDPATETGYRALRRYAGRGDAAVIGRRSTADPINATFFNTLSSSAHGYDDAHLATVAHPGGPAAAAALAAAQMTNAPGTAVLNALLLGIEVQCRVSNALVAEPGSVSLGFYMTGLTGALGAAAAGKLLGLDERRMCWALGIAATQGAGFRETHGSMSNALVRAQATRNGLTAALLAQDGFTCSDTALEGDTGFLAVFASNAHAGLVCDGLGSTYQLLQNTYKPYPCGMPINPVIDASLEIAERATLDEIECIELRVNPLALALTGRRDPTEVEDARFSLFHWAAAALVRKRAGLAEIERECIVDPLVVQTRALITVAADDALAPASARATARLTGGRQITAHVERARGSIARPMSNAELELKFELQTNGVLDRAAVAALISECWGLASEHRLSERPLTRLL